jgi:hypothetical protein
MSTLKENLEVTRLSSNALGDDSNKLALMKQMMKASDRPDTDFDAVKNFGIFNIIHDRLAIDRELFPDQLV